MDDIFSYFFYTDIHSAAELQSNFYIIKKTCSTNKLSTVLNERTRESGDQ